MTFINIDATGTILDQGRIKNYGIDISFTLKDLGLDFTGFLCKPKSIGQKAMLDSFNEMIRESCYKFVETNKLTTIGGATVTGPALYAGVMEMIIESINNIKERGDSLFIVKASDTQYRKAKTDRKKKLQELENIKAESNNIDMQIEKEKMKIDLKKEVLKEFKSKGLEIQLPIKHTETGQVKQTQTQTQTEKKEDKPKKKQYTTPGKKRKYTATIADMSHIFKP